MSSQHTVMPWFFSVETWKKFKKIICIIFFYFLYLEPEPELSYFLPGAGAHYNFYMTTMTIDYWPMTFDHWPCAGEEVYCWADGLPPLHTIQQNPTPQVNHPFWKLLYLFFPNGAVTPSHQRFYSVKQWPCKHARIMLRDDSVRTGGAMQYSTLTIPFLNL